VEISYGTSVILYVIDLVVGCRKAIVCAQVMSFVSIPTLCNISVQAHIQLYSCLLVRQC